MTVVITWVVDCGDGDVIVRRHQAMIDFFRGLGIVGLGTLVGRVLGAVMFLAVDASFSKQVDAVLEVTVANPL